MKFGPSSVVFMGSVAGIGAVTSPGSLLDEAPCKAPAGPKDWGVKAAVCCGGLLKKSSKLQSGSQLVISVAVAAMVRVSVSESPKTPTFELGGGKEDWMVFKAGKGAVE